MTETMQEVPPPVLGRHADRVRRMARLLDRAVTVPGTRIGLGLDGLLGLVPGAGDVAGGALSLYILFLAWRAGAPGPVLTRMAVNVGIDVLLGTVPVLGDIADFAFKANLRNADLLDRALGEPDRTRKSSKAWLIVAGTIVVLILLGVIGLVVGGIRLLASLV